MERASIKSNMGDSHVRENCKDLDSEDKIRRLERRWKRRENCNASATRTTVKSEVNKAVLTEKNGYMVEDEVDEDYKFFLDTYVSDIDLVSDNNVDGSDADVDTDHNSDNDIDSDPQYKKFLENLRKEGNSYVYSCFVENQLVHVRYEGEEEEEERLHNGLKLDTKMLNGLTQRDETGNVGNIGIDSLREQTGGSMESQQNMETERVHCNKKRANEDVSGVPNKRFHSDVEFDVSGVPNKSCHSDVEFDVDEDYQLFLNSWTDDDNLVHMGGELMGKTTRVQCDKAFVTREVQCGIDEDYQLFLNSADIVHDDLVFMRDRNISKINKMEGGSNVDGSDADVDTDHNSDNDIDSDPQYKKFLENLRKEGNSYVYSCFVENQLVHVRYEGEEEEEEERLHNGLKLDTKMLNGLTERDETGNVGNIGIDSLREQTGGSMESQQNMETERVHCKKRANEDVSGVPNKRFHSDVEFDVSGVPNKSCHSDVEFDVDEDYQLFLNSWTDNDNLVHMGGELMGKTTRVQCDKAFDTHEVQCDIDEDYQLFLNSADIVHDDLVFTRDRNISKINKMEGGSNSSDPDLILLEPDEICENTPFISSKTYDSSWFESEMKPRHSGEFSAYDHSQFRKKLMEYLERPYDKQEYEFFMHELHQRRQKERHLETRQGVIKSYHTHGETKSYLELYPDLSEAIAGLKEQPHRILFLLRGFIFWLQNVSDNGNFRPWLDESCLEILRKM